MKWVDNHKGVFNVEVVAVSSIHTQVSELIIFMIKHHLNELNILSIKSVLLYAQRLMRLHVS